MAKKWILTLECGHTAIRPYVPKRQAMCDKCGTAQLVESYKALEKIRPPKPTTFEGVVPP